MKHPIHPSTTRFIPRLATLAAALLPLAILPLPATARTTPQADEATVLEKIIIEDIPADQSILPTRPLTSLYGFEETIRETPRSVFQLTKAHLANDNITTFAYLARYSPGIQRSSVSPYTVPRIRGSSADTLRNNITLFNTAVRAFNDNAWESADIVAGIPSVIQGNTSRTAGYVNYVTKKPYFGENQTELTVKFGRLGPGRRTSYGQYAVQLDHSTELVKDKLALRFSLLQAEANLYWGNSEADTKDLFAALAWRPNPNVTLDLNLSYTNATGASPGGINRVTQNLIDNWIYRAGTATPAFEEDTHTNAQGQPATYTTEGGATIYKLTGWTIASDDAHNVKIRGDQTAYSPDAGSLTNEYVAQTITAVRLTDSLTLRNNSIFQFSDNSFDTYDFSVGTHSNKLFESRFELLTDNGKTLRHQSNSGVSFRWLKNTCEVAAGASGIDPSAQADATQPGSITAGRPLGITGPLFDRGPGSGTAPGSVHPDGLHGLIYSPTYQKWITWTPTIGNRGFAVADAAFAANPANATARARTTGPGLALRGGGEARVNTLATYNAFTEHKFDLGEKWTWRIGARLSFVDDEITANSQSQRYAQALRDNGIADLNTYDDITAWNGDINTSLNFRPVRWASTYLALDHNISSQDCGCCQTQGFTGLGNTLSADYFKVESDLVELGAKFELIQNKLFASAAFFHQTRQTASIDSYTGDPIINDLVYEGVELALNYQPAARLAAGANYSCISATYDGGTNHGKRFQGSPLNSANLWATCRFNSGLGIKARAHLTSSWNVNIAGTLKVPAQYQIDLGAFYLAKNWRLDLDLANLTDEKNWSAAGGAGGDGYSTLLPAERLGLSGKFTCRF